MAQENIVVDLIDGSLSPEDIYVDGITLDLNNVLTLTRRSEPSLTIDLTPLIDNFDDNYVVAGSYDDALKVLTLSYSDGVTAPIYIDLTSLSVTEYGGVNYDPLFTYPIGHIVSVPSGLVYVSMQNPQTKAPGEDESVWQVVKTDQTPVLTERATDILQTNNGYNRHEMETLGITEFCADASSGIVHQFKSIAGVMTYTKLTSQTSMAFGTTYQTTINDRKVVLYPHENKLTYDYYINHEKYENNSLTSVFIPTTGSGIYWIYYSADTGLFTAGNSTTEDLFEDCAISAIVYYNETLDEYILFANEQHGIEWTGSLHKYTHKNIGALYTSGLSIVGLSDGGGSYTHIESGWIADEDIDNFSFQQTLSPFWYKIGTTSEWQATDIDLNLAIMGTTYAYYNEWTGTNWKLTEISNNTYTLVHMLRTNDGEYPMIKVMGENIYNTSVAARAAAAEEINQINLEGLPTPEIVNCYTIIVDHNGNLVDNADGSLYIDWRGSGSKGTSGGDTSIGTTLHANLTDTASSGHPTEAITYDTTVTFDGLLDYGTVSSSQLLDLRASQYQTITVDAHINFTFTAPTGPATIYVHIHQGATGGLVTLPAGEWVDGVPLSNTFDPGIGHDLLMVHYDGSGYVFGMMQNLS